MQLIQFKWWRTGKLHSRSSWFYFNHNIWTHHLRVFYLPLVTFKKQMQREMIKKNKSNLCITWKNRFEIFWCFHYKFEIMKFKSRCDCCFTECYIGSVFSNGCINSKLDITAKVVSILEPLRLDFVINVCTTINLNKGRISTKFSY